MPATESSWKVYGIIITIIAVVFTFTVTVMVRPMQENIVTLQQGKADKEAIRMMETYMVEMIQQGKEERAELRADIKELLRLVRRDGVK